MRCKYCDKILEQSDYAWDDERKEFVETGKHYEGNCTGAVIPDTVNDFIEEIYYDDNLDAEQERLD